MMSSLVTPGPARSARQCAILTPAEGSAFAAPIALNRPVCVVGDRSRVHLVLASPLVSRSHALLVDDADGLYVRDLASSNGVLINDQKVLETVLHNGDRLRIGPFAFQCRVAKPAADSHSAPAPAEVRGEGFAPLSLDGRRTMLIGSRRGCDVRLNGIGVSSVHAVIFRRHARWFIRDLSSEGGTRVLGRLIREAELFGGEQIRIGAAAIWYIRPDLELPSPDQTDAAGAAEQALEASLLDGVEAIEVGPDESAMDVLPTVTENWSRQEGFEAPQVTAADLGLDQPIPNSALASASNLQSMDPEQTLMDASRSILTLEDLIDMPTGTPEDLGLADDPEPRREEKPLERAAERNESRSRTPPPPVDEANAFDHELIGNPEESGALPQPWALLGIDSALADMGLGEDAAPRAGRGGRGQAGGAAESSDPQSAQSLHQLTFVPLVAGWAKCPGCGAAFPLTSSRPL